ncbi:MAG TPA: hypothetical protein PK808_11920 [Polymorphobacter sp.]|nr:hypothetical protein [Polymorphobacter sp.]
MTETPAVPPPAPVKTALKMVVVIPVLLIAYIMICGALGLTTMYTGFFFVLYWGAVRHAAPDQFLPALVGSIAGLGLAWLATLMAPQGTPGLIVVIGLILLALFLDMVRWVPLVFNTAFMLFLTVGGIPPVAEKGNFGEMILTLLVAAGFFGGIIAGYRWVQARRAPAGAAV